MYLYVGLPEVIYHHVRFEGFQQLPTSGEQSTAIQESTHSAMANSVNHQQVIVMNEYFIAIRYLLHN
jgi:hypothetical protein